MYLVIVHADYAGDQDSPCSVFASEEFILPKIEDEDILEKWKDACLQNHASKTAQIYAFIHSVTKL